MNRNSFSTRAADLLILDNCELGRLKWCGADDDIGHLSSP
jgi:hypothetical protein